MKKTITEYEFIDTMTEQGNGFTYDGAKLLFEYLEEYEESCGTEIDFDPIALRCDFSEYCAADYINDYHEISDHFIQWLVDNEHITEEKSEKLIENNYFKFNANDYSYDILNDYFEEELKDNERIANYKDSDTFIINTNF